jgi:hypothetical protein
MQATVDFEVQEEGFLAKRLAQPKQKLAVGKVAIVSFYEWITSRALAVGNHGRQEGGRSEVRELH